MTEETIATATDAEIDECVALIALAFAADPAVRGSILTRVPTLRTFRAS